MIGAGQQSMSSAIDPTLTVTRYLKDDDAVVRCASARALGALGDETAAPALVEALLDEDPDVRVDAMEALIRCARPDDAEAIRRSLEGDPEKEVKLFAIQALARLEDSASLPLLRRLVKDRAEDDVAWEDDGGLGDDWLDIQIAAITALGQLQASEAIDDLLDARTDEMGQELDGIVFQTLAVIEGGGMAALVDMLRDRDPRVRARAVKAMQKARPEALAPMRDLLLRDADPAIRKLALATLEPDSPKAFELATEDADAGVREAAIRAFAERSEAIAKAALRDDDERIRGAALQAMIAGDPSARPLDLADNVQAWMMTAEPPLAAIAASALPKLAGSRALPPLCWVADDIERPVDVRIAALRALDVDLEDPASLDHVFDTLQARAVDPIRQLRAAALASLARLAKEEDGKVREKAETLLIAAIEGELGADVQGLPALEASSGDDVRAPKVEDRPGRITISPDGDIIRVDEDQENPDEPADPADVDDDTVIQGHFPQSTLDAIQTVPSVPGLGEEAGGFQPQGRKRRVAVDGPEDVATDIRRIALTMAAECPGARLGKALTAALSDEESTVRSSAFRALAQRPATSGLGDIGEVIASLQDPDPTIRHDAARIIAHARPAEARDHLEGLQDDPDAMVRATAIDVIGRAVPEKALAALGDASSLVRRSAWACLLEEDQPALLAEGLDRCLADGRSDTLIDGCRQSPDARLHLMARLGEKPLKRLEILTALEALSAQAQTV